MSDKEADDGEVHGVWRDGPPLVRAKADAVLVAPREPPLRDDHAPDFLREESVITGAMSSAFTRLYDAHEALKAESAALVAGLRQELAEMTQSREDYKAASLKAVDVAQLLLERVDAAEAWRDTRHAYQVFKLTHDKLAAAEGVIAGLRALVAEWRACVQSFTEHPPDGRFDCDPDTLTDCVDQLEALLALPRPGRAQEDEG